MTTRHLRTPRLLLRPVTAADAPALATAINDWDVARWLARVPSPYGLDDAEAFVALAVEGGPLERSGERTWVITDPDGRLLGVVGLGTAPDQEFGYWLAPDAWGRGLATEAGQAVLADHFADPAAGDVISGWFDGNERSERVLLKLGFREVGVHPRFCLARGEDVTSHAMRLRRETFAA